MIRIILSALFLFLTTPAIASGETINDNRILMWRENIETGSWAIHSQVLTGGDASCLRFTGELATLRESEQDSRCLNTDGLFLFEVECKPPSSALMLGSHLLSSAKPAICKKK